MCGGVPGKLDLSVNGVHNSNSFKLEAYVCIQFNKKHLLELTTTISSNSTWKDSVLIDEFKLIELDYTNGIMYIQ